MCIWFMISMLPSEFVKTYKFTDFPPNFKPPYNVTPTKPAAVVRDIETRRVEWLQWGLIPSWAKDPTIGKGMVNARAETLAEKPSFRAAYQKRRCLVLADGFYEWQKIPGERSVQRYFSLKDNVPFVFAGLWEIWKPAENEAIASCTIVTCPPNSLVGAVHDRMPVILDPVSAESWMSQATHPQLQSLLMPFPSDLMQLAAI
jgi:putative SOS response-associated peptidase YedK